MAAKRILPKGDNFEDCMLRYLKHGSILVAKFEEDYLPTIRAGEVSSFYYGVRDYYENNPSRLKNTIESALRMLCAQRSVLPQFIDKKYDCVMDHEHSESFIEKLLKTGHLPAQADLQIESMAHTNAICVLFFAFEFMTEERFSKFIGRVRTAESRQKNQFSSASSLRPRHNPATLHDLKLMGYGLGLSEMQTQLAIEGLAVRALKNIEAHAERAAGKWLDRNKEHGSGGFVDALKHYRLQFIKAEIANGILENTTERDYSEVQALMAKDLELDMGGGKSRFYPKPFVPEPPKAANSN